MNPRLREQQREGTLVLMTMVAFAAALFLSHRSFVEAEKESQKRNAAESETLLVDEAGFEVGGAELTDIEVVQPSEVMTPEPTVVPTATPTLSPSPSPTPSPTATLTPFKATPAPQQQTVGRIFGGFSPSLETSRIGHLAELIDGRLLVAAGTDGRRPLSSVEIVDYVSNESLFLEDAVTPRLWGSSVVLEKNMVILGGVNLVNNDASALQPVAPVELLNAETLEKVVVTLHPNPRVRAGAALVDNKVYYIGGSVEGEVSGEVNIYDFDTNSWSMGAAMPNPREVPLVVNNGLIYAPGGRIPGYGSVFFHMYDPVADKWIVMPALPEPRSHHAAFADGSRIWLLGDDTFTNVGLVYDFVGLVWSVRSFDMYDKLPRYSAGAQSRDTALLVGGIVSQDNIPINAIWNVPIGE